MSKRISLVDNIKVTNVSLSSIFQVGDSFRLAPQVRALAVQRQEELFFSDEGNFQAYPVFTRPLPKLVSPLPVTTTRLHDSRFIKVRNINVISASSSGIVHIGSTRQIDAEARVKHIRQLHSTPEGNDII